MTRLNFDFWLELARRDPAAFFHQRELEISRFIAAHPQSRDDLLDLQRQVDSIRATAGSPRRAVQDIFELLDRHLEALASALDQLRLGVGKADKPAARVD